MMKAHNGLRFFRANSTALGALLAGGLLIFLAAQHVYVAFLALPAANLIFAIDHHSPISPQARASAEAALKQAKHLGTDTAMLNSQLSYLILDRLATQPLDEEAHAELELVRLYVEEALKRRPLDAYLWTRMSHVTYLLDGLSPYTLVALERSFSYGSHETELFLYRITFCMYEWDKLPPRIKQLVRSQLAKASGSSRLLSRVLGNVKDRHYATLLGLLEGTKVHPDIVKRLEAGILRAEKARLTTPTRAE